MTTPTLDELVSDYKNLPTSDHAHAIGHLCLQWNFVEHTSDIFLSFLANLDDTEIRAAIINNADARDKWRMIDAVGFIKRPNDDWYRRLKEVINRINNELRPERNRMVHDRWISLKDEIVRLTPMGKIIKEQSRQLAFKAGYGKPIKEAEVWELVVSVSAVGGYLSELFDEYINSKTAQQPSPQKSD